MRTAAAAREQHRADQHQHHVDDPISQRRSHARIVDGPLAVRPGPDISQSRYRLGTRLPFLPPFLSDTPTNRYFSWVNATACDSRRLGGKLVLAIT
jgi:hypothetical protein